MADKTRHVYGKEEGIGKIPNFDDNSIGPDLIAWNKFKIMLNKSIKAGQLSSNTVVSNYSLIHTT
jgi:hypothetical protein